MTSPALRQIAVSTVELIGGTPIADAAWTLWVITESPITAGDDLASQGQITSGVLDSAGETTLELTDSPTGSYYRLEIDGADANAASLVRAFGPIAPIGPVPGRSGPGEAIVFRVEPDGATPPTPPDRHGRSPPPADRRGARRRPQRPAACRAALARSRPGRHLAAARADSSPATLTA